MSIRVRMDRKFVCFAAGVLLTAAAAHAQGNLTGYWDLRVPNGDGTFRETFFELTQNGNTLTGKWYGRDPNGIPMQGSIEAGKVHFATVPPPPPPNATPGGFGGRPTVYDGALHGDTMTLTSTGFRGQTMTGEAVRSTREAAMPPAPLPLPALRDLPDNGLVRTPPMGWNSWNKFAGRVTEADVRAAADALVSTGMSKMGYIYVNIDDTWEGGRDANGNIQLNQKFHDMKALADYVHSKGLKLGIYSSPGPKNCAGYTGSFGHEAQDAKTYASWGIDYLKYDLCSARNIYKSTPEIHQALYQKMGEALQSTGRPIVFSLCQYGENDPWKWGYKAGGNLWRTTGDIRDQWESMDRIGFSQIDIATYNHPGRWNDPDMLEVGNGGMSADEYRTHMSLWSLLSAPLIAGNDLSNMSEETKSILMNGDVIAIDQDSAVHPVQRQAKQGTVEVLTRLMSDGSTVVGLFNRGNAPAPASLDWTALSTRPGFKVRDLWKHEPVNVSGTPYQATVPVHGVVLLRVTP
ncbi:glycoside hydrolase family 27 protein [Terriglobus roseus]|uniref:Alpha-galactosidase n=1 Tax=Terriglobus roseus TaxID=392734 RepID=A0A1G7GNQ6_9BACT|nr:glycoside hydrolase family 27 protein [Terriglobus roseus]SDE89736.1 alpha-galactosidase [Terriglobus roseus]